jgi:GT2 family glycosyltransferase
MTAMEQGSIAQRSVDRHAGPRVGIVVLNWNQPTDTLACLESLRHVSYPAYQVILVDNGSTDGSPALVRERHPDVTLIQNPTNLGFAGGNNVGIARALRDEADYVMLLNNDTELAPEMLRTLVDVAEGDPTIGVVGPKIYYYDEASVIWSAGGGVDKLGQPWHYQADQVDDGSRQHNEDVDYVTGCAILVKRGVIDAIGALDERFFIYFEETEWCARARRAGYRVVYVPSARMWHKIQPTARPLSRRYLYLMTRNRLLYLRCSKASPVTTIRAMLDVVRTAAAWRLRSRHRQMRPFAGTLLLALRDFLRGRFGAPPSWDRPANPVAPRT